MSGSQIILECLPFHCAYALHRTFREADLTGVLSQILALGLAAFALLAWWKWPPWLVVVLGALGGMGLARL